MTSLMKNKRHKRHKRHKRNKKLVFSIATLLGIVCLNGTAIAAQPNTAQNQAIDRVLPVSPNQVRALKQKEAAINQAMQSQPISNRQLRSTVRTINLTDSAPPPLLHVVSGYTTNVSFMGANGSPWPILSGVAGGAAIAVIQPSKEDPYNASIVVNQPWVSTNVSFYLKGRVRPVTLYLYTAGDTKRGLDGNVTIKIDGLPPGSSPNPIKNVTAVSDALLNSLSHAPGSNWENVKLASQNIPVGIHYWISPNHKTAIIRLSSGTLVMPGWGSQASSPDNTTTSYEFNTIPLMLWVDSSDGQSFQLRVNDATQLIAGGNPILKVKNVSPPGAGLPEPQGAKYAK